MLLFCGELLLVFITDYICVAPLSLSVVFPIIRGLTTGSWAAALILCLAIPAVWYRHTVNIRRIADGTEAHFSFLWNRKHETDRIAQGTTNTQDAESEPSKKN